MLNTPTTFVIGAGSGFDLKMPLGGELLEMIGRSATFRVQHSQLVDDNDLTRVVFMEETGPNTGRIRNRADMNEIFNANQLIRNATKLIGSIDDYVNMHSDNAHLVRSAKAHIAYNILLKERASSLFVSREENERSPLDRLEACWLRDLLILISKPSLSTRPEDLFRNVNIISFNYDRCLEHFLLHAVENLYAISSQASAEIIRNANIIHPYGQVGQLSTVFQNGVPFGGGNDYVSLKRAAESLITYSEQAEKNIISRCKSTIENSKRIVFLGFGFHQQNVDLLSLARAGDDERAIYATAIGVSATNKLSFSRKLRRIGGFPVPGQRMPGGITLDSGASCSKLLADYSEDLLS